MKSDFKKDGAALPDKLRDTYNDTLQHLFKGTVPKRSVRLDVVQACVEAFDCLVKLIARSEFCIYELEQPARFENHKVVCSRDCERCVRSYVYKALDHENTAAMTAKENEL